MRHPTILQVGTSPFQGGQLPSIADLSVFGVLRAIEGYEVFADVQVITRESYILTPSSVSGILLFLFVRALYDF